MRSPKLYFMALLQQLRLLLHSGGDSRAVGGRHHRAASGLATNDLDVKMIYRNAPICQGVDDSLTHEIFARRRTRASTRGLLAPFNCLEIVSAAA